MKRIVIFTADFTIPTDLAGAFRSWPEFQAGIEYTVDLVSADAKQVVSMQMTRAGDDDLVMVTGSEGDLFDRAVGRAAYTLGSQYADLVISSGILPH